MVFKSLSFPLLRALHEVDSNVSTDRSLCPWEDHRDAESWYSGFHITFAMASKAPNSPDLNPVNYTIWGKLQEPVYRTQIRVVYICPPNGWAIRGGVVQIWPRVTGAAVTQWQARLRACVKADRGHFEYFLWQLMNDHTVSLKITERVVRVVTKTCFLTSNWKRNKIWSLR